MLIEAVESLGLHEPAAGLDALVQLLDAAAAGRPPPELLVARLCDPEVVVKLGALEGVVFLGDQAPVSVIGPLAGVADPRVRVRAWVALFADGEVVPDGRFSRLAGRLAPARRGDDRPAWSSSIGSD